jgi:hypothetical protein
VLRQHAAPRNKGGFGHGRERHGVLGGVAGYWLRATG